MLNRKYDEACTTIDNYSKQQAINSSLLKVFTGIMAMSGATPVGPIVSTSAPTLTYMGSGYTQVVMGIEEIREVETGNNVVKGIVGEPTYQDIDDMTKAINDISFLTISTQSLHDAIYYRKVPNNSMTTSNIGQKANTVSTSGYCSSLEEINAAEQENLERFKPNLGTQAAVVENSVVEGGSSSVTNLIGHDFEDYLTNNIGGEGSFSIGGREFDGGMGNRWWEAKSGQYWEMLEENPDKLLKFKSDMGERLRIAQENDATYELISNTRIPYSIKQWLDKKGIKYTELLD